MSSVAFLTIPQDLRVPGVFAEFDPSRASAPATLRWRSLVFGQKLSTGAWTTNTIQTARTLDAVIAGAGRGSMLHQQARAFFAANQLGEVAFAVLGDDAGGTAATGSITFVGTSSGSGTYPLYIGGVRITTSIASGTAQNAIATAVAAAINAKTDLPVTALASTNVVTITCRHKGEIGNQIDVRANYLDTDADVPGVTATIVAMASGATNPSLSGMITALGDTWYQSWALPYKDATSLSAIEAELESRAGYARMVDGFAITGHSDTAGNMTTLGATRNSARDAILEVNQSPTPAYEMSAAAVGVVMTAVAADPGCALIDLPLPGVLPPKETQLRTKAERNTALFYGITPIKVPSGGSTVYIDRLITTYRQTAGGTDDTTYLDASTMYKLMYVRYSFRSRMSAKFSRFKLADDGAKFGAGQRVVTPSIFKAEVLAWFQELQDQGIVENYEAFKAALVVERSTQDRNRIDCKLPIDLINFLAVTAAQFSFVL